MLRFNSSAEDIKNEKGKESQQPLMRLQTSFLRLHVVISKLSKAEERAWSYQML